MNILKIKGIGYFREKKDRGANELLRQISKPPPISPVFFISVLYLSIQSFPLEKYVIGF